MKGIILAGGKGTRLAPMSNGVNKHLMPVYDKPMIYYPLTTLMLAGVRDITIVCNPEDTDRFEHLLGNGSEFGISLSYCVQEQSNGIVGALESANREAFNDGPLALILGDNFFFGSGVGLSLRAAFESKGALCIVKRVSNPSSFGVCLLDRELVTDIEEKPVLPKSNLAVTGLYFLDSSWSKKTERVVQSARGELEITDLLSSYIGSRELRAKKLSRGTVWFDLGTVQDLFAASRFVETIQNTSSTLVGSPHEVAVLSGWRSRDDVLGLCQSGQGKYYDLLEMTLSTDFFAESA